MASLVLSVVYATDQRRNHRLYPRHLHLSGVGAGALGLQRVGDPGVNAVLLGQALAFATPGKSNVGGVLEVAGACRRRGAGLGTTVRSATCC